MELYFHNLASFMESSTICYCELLIFYEYGDLLILRIFIFTECFRFCQTSVCKIGTNTYFMNICKIS